MLGELRGEHRQNVEFGPRGAKRLDCFKNTGERLGACGVGAEPIVQIAVAVQRDAYQEIMLRQKSRPCPVDEVSIGLQRIMDGLVGALTCNMSSESLEVFKSGASGFSALERKGYIGVVTEPKRGVDESLHDVALHDAKARDLAMLSDVGVKAIATAHVAQ